ncbi:MAG: hypothetical protein J0M12_11665 [Deltaproteobacteria bacterium]|nr:hypothetical protein [Deltaproteobacteria bacterium]
MLPFTTQDAVSVLKKSDNLNSALKNFLKREIRNGDPAARFVKDLRELSDSSNTTRLESYIDRNRAKFELQLVAVGAHAHPNLVESIAAKVTEKYADTFNETYKLEEEKIEVTDKKGFDQIVKQALTLIDEDLKAAGFGDSPYIKNSVMLAIFDKRVLDYILSSTK